MPTAIPREAPANPCDICGGRAAFAPNLTVNVAGIFTAEIGRCPGCGFRQIRPRPTPGELALCYTDTYFDSAGVNGFRDYARQQQRHERESYFLAKQLRRLRPQGRLLEVGCALGFLLDGIRRFTDWRVEGLDIAAFGVYFARERLGLTVSQSTLAEAAYPDACFDFVVQKDLLEHVDRPRTHLQETARILKPGGRLWLVTPNGEANLHPLAALGRKLKMDDPDRLPLLEQAHVSFFSRTHLQRLFEECGFRVLRLRSVSIKRGLRALGRLPSKHRVPTAPAGSSRQDTAALRSASAGPEEISPDLVSLAQRMETDLKRYHKPFRSHPLYFHLRHWQDSLDSLPGALAWGTDFDCLLEKLA